jgi:hypothetical protein
MLKALGTTYTLCWSKICGKELGGGSIFVLSLMGYFLRQRTGSHHAHFKTE